MRIEYLVVPKLVEEAVKVLAKGEMFIARQTKYPDLSEKDFQIQLTDGIKASGLTHKVTFSRTKYGLVVTAYPLPISSLTSEQVDERFAEVARAEMKARTGVILKHVLTAFLVGVLCGLAISFPIHSKGVQHVEDLRKR